jgi:biotin carboxylase
MSSRRALLLLGAGPEQVEALRIARELGYRTIAFDNDREAVGRGFADSFVQVDLKDESALLGASELAAPDGVFVHAAELAVEAARVAEWLDLPGLSVETARTATDKSLRIERLASEGIATPGFDVLESAASFDDWRERFEDYGFPRVVKPTNQAGARGVELISSSDELRSYYARRETFASKQFVCEQLLEGLQLSTESVAVDQKILHHAIALRHYDTTGRYRPFFIEDGHSLPFSLPEERRMAVEHAIERCFRVLGVSTGVLKGDLVLGPDDEVFVLEMAVRTSGGRFADTVVPLGTGVQILYPLIELAMGDSFSQDWFTPTRNVGVSQRFFLHEGACKVDRWPAIRRLVGRPGISEWRLNESMFATGVLPDVQSHRDRLGYVICTGNTREEADAQALEVTSAFGRDLKTSALGGSVE